LNTKEYSKESGELWTKDKNEAVSFEFKEYAILYLESLQKYSPDRKLVLQVIEQRR
jgi:hypothetical protein